MGPAWEQKGASRGSMRSRSTSDKRSEDERRTNGPININKRFHEVEIDKRQEKRRRAKNEWTYQTLTKGSMRWRLTSDKTSEDEQRTNEPWEVHLELRIEEYNKGTKIERASLLKHQNSAEFFLQLALWDQG